MRVFFDTNVLVSAFTAPHGVCFQLLKKVYRTSTFVTGEFVLGELERILLNKSRIAEKDVDELLNELRKFEIHPIPIKPSSISIRDSDDEFVLASALEAKVDILVTGDKDLLEIDDKVSIKIINPRKLLNILEESKE